MTWTPVILGVNGSEESVRAASAGAIVARQSGMECFPVFAAPDYARLLGGLGVVDPGWIASDAYAADREAIMLSLKGRIPDAALVDLEVTVGRASRVLAAAARRRGAGIIAVGSRPRRGLDRIGHDTARHLLRSEDFQLLVAGGGGPTIRRIIAAVDASAAARPTIETAIRWADLFHAELRILHAVEPLPTWAGSGQVARHVEEVDCHDRLLQIGIEPIARAVGAECVVRQGNPAPVIRREVSRWKADLVVMGSHGRGFVDRLLLGSTTERLLRAAPSLMLVIPIGAPAADRPLGVENMPWENAVSHA